MISRYAAPPYPAAPDFLHGKACHTILRSLCSLTNRVPLPPHPGDRINRSMLSCRGMAPLLSTHSAPSKRGKGGGASHQRGNAFPTPAGRLYCFIQTDAFYKFKGALHGSCPLSEATQPFYTTLGTKGRRPDGCHTPLCAAGAGPFGNTGKHRPDPGPDPGRAISPIKKAALRQQVDGN